MKRLKSSIGLIVLVLGVITLGIDRMFVSADSDGGLHSMTIWTVVALIFFLVGAIWLFKTLAE